MTEPHVANRTSCAAKSFFFRTVQTRSPALKQKCSFRLGMDSKLVRSLVTLTPQANANRCDCRSQTEQCQVPSSRIDQLVQCWKADVLT